MTKDKKVLYVTSVVILAVFLLLMFVDVGSSKIAAAILLLPATFAVCVLIRKRTSVSINKKEVLLLVTIMAAVLAILLHMSGLFFGYYKNPYFVTPRLLIKTILPMAVIIIASEIIRFVFLSQKNAFVGVISFLLCLILEILMFASIPEIRTFNKFMDLVGLTLFPAIGANAYYHYISKHYGAIPNIMFRLITTLYSYFIPTAVAMPDALLSCVKIIFPIFMLLFVSAMFAKKKKYAMQKGKKVEAVVAVFTVAILISSAMLISCQFRFGALVIATESMTGEINKGDVIIYERYDSQSIKEGQVIVFLDNQNKIVHRVVEIQSLGGEIRYYTQGDANEDRDGGYRTDADIVGLTDFKIASAGYPTLWLRELLKGKR